MAAALALICRVAVGELAELKLGLEPKSGIPFLEIASLIETVLVLSISSLIPASNLLLHVLVEALHLVVVELQLRQKFLLHNPLLFHMKIDFIFWQLHVQVLVVSYYFVVQLLQDLDERIILILHPIQIDLIPCLLRQVQVFPIVPRCVLDL